MLTSEQQTVLDKLMSFIHSKRSGEITVGGYAGTGKTYLITQLRKKIREVMPSLLVAFVTFTGKASFVLRSKLIEENSIFKNDNISTIHSLIYRPEYEYDYDLKKKVITGWNKINNIDYDVIIIDEASMVSEYIWEDLKSYDVPIIAVGDHGQLPPVGSEFHLMNKPDLVLNTIHRQAEKSPIIKLSMIVRDKGYIPTGVFSNNVFKLPWDHPNCKGIWDKVQFDKSVIILCGFNKTRVTLNNMIRARLNFSDSTPYPKERLICLKNNRSTKISNGQIGTVVWLMPQSKELFRVTLELDNTESLYENLVYNDCFGKESYDTMYDKKQKIKNKLTTDYFDFGYAISVHKSQGSEWDKVVLFEQRSQYWDDEYYKRWLYTGITRARERLFVISNFY